MTLPMPASCFNIGVFSEEGEIEMPTALLREEIFTHVQSLRAHAFLLVGDRAVADDIAEETIRTAWRDFATLPLGDNLRAWLFTILGAVLVSSPNSDPSGPAKPDETGQKVRLQGLADFRRAFASIPVTQREALLLTVAARFSNEDAASICGCSGEVVMTLADRGRQAMSDMLAPTEIPKVGVENDRGR